MIAFRDVTVRYPGSQRLALEHASLAAERGAVTAVVGPNGSGKSTLVRALLGRVPLLTGAVEVDGETTAGMGRGDLARRVAVVAQREEPAFPLTVTDYVSLGRYPHQGAWAPPAAADRVAVDRAMEAASVAELGERRTTTLSGGEWQRARVARALAQDTDAVVFDEPTTFLDIAHEMACFELLSAIAHAGRCVLVVSHQLNLVARFADRVVLLSHGTVVADGSPSTVMRGETLERVYEWPLVVSRDPAVGAPTLVPLRKPRSPIA
ncbi:MAG: ABC transporter ATP-binding protein [Gemmatimonadaceae bacterium]